MATVRTRIGPADHGRVMTLEDLWEAEEQPGFHYELVRGVLEVSEIPGDSHYQVVDNHHEMFGGSRRWNPRVILRVGRGSDLQYIIPDDNTARHPDPAVVFRDHTQRDSRGHVLSALAVEVVSFGKRSRDRDSVEKRSDYLAVGLLEHWIVDPDLRQVTVLTRREADGVASWNERVFREDETIEGELLLGFTGTVSGRWADVDEV